MKVAIILLNYKDYADRFLADCAESLRHIKFPEGEHKIFIVDNETSDETRQTIATLCPEAEIVPNEENAGYGEGNNTGIRKAIEQGFEYFYILNMDTEVEPDCLSEAVLAYDSDPKIGILQSRVMLHHDKTKINSIGNHVHYLGFGYSGGYNDEYTDRPDIEDITYASGAALLIHKKVIDTIGFFTKDFFMYHDDIEWGLKAKLAGYRVVVANKSVIYHKYEFSRSITKYYWMERNRLILNLMVFKVPTLVLLFPAWIAMETGLLVFAVKGGWWKEKLRVYRWFTYPINLKKVSLWRRRTQMLRTIKDKQLMHDFVSRIDYQEPEMQNWLLTKVANPAFTVYWRISKYIIFW